MSGSNSDTIIEVVRAQVPTLAQYIAGNLPSGITTTDTITENTESLTAVINTYIALNGNVDMPLANISVDFETNKAEMMSLLSTAGSGSWSDTVISGTGQTLTEMIAAALTYMQFNVVRSAQEVMMDTMTLINSIYAGVRHLGQRIARRVPGVCTATLNYSGSVPLTIPAYTTFSINNIYYFNREPIAFGTGINTLYNVSLYEGQVYSTGFVSTGAPFQAFVFGNSDYTISDVDVAVTINSSTWTPTIFATYFNVGLWEYSGTSQVFSTYTTSDGNVEIRFGNNTFGQVPPANSEIKVNFVSTNGAAGNQNLSGYAISCSAISTITGTVTTQTVNGADPLSPGSYKFLGPGSYAAKYRASSRPDYSSIALQYPGVLDALFLFQQDFAPYDISQMMIAKAILLTDSSWTTSTFNSFTAWLNNLGIANMQYLEQQPIQTVLNISANIYCFSNADLDSVYNTVYSAITAAFALGQGSLAYPWYLSDIEDVIKSADPVNIDYFQLLEPTTDTPTVAPNIINTDSTSTINSTQLTFALTTGVTVGQMVNSINVGSITYNNIPSNTFVTSVSTSTVSISNPTTGIVPVGEPINFQFPNNYGYISLGSITLNIYYSTRPVRAV